MEEDEEEQEVEGVEDEEEERTEERSSKGQQFVPAVLPQSVISSSPRGDVAIEGGEQEEEDIKTSDDDADRTGWW